jgi:hypothetical protein
MPSSKKTGSLNGHSTPTRPKRLSRIPFRRRWQLAEAGDIPRLLRELATTPVAEMQWGRELQQLYDTIERRLQGDFEQATEQAFTLLLANQQYLMHRVQLAVSKHLAGYDNPFSGNRSTELPHDFAERWLPLLTTVQNQWLSLLSEKVALRRMSAIAREKELQNERTVSRRRRKRRTGGRKNGRPQAVPHAKKSGRTLIEPTAPLNRLAAILPR